ncbi:MAG: arginine--tRNA ligase, partial [Candidatus Omnitrophica bacterium]|nr:arginine--tRNA ligase [Candidatus Omnitrophota bacterium]
MNENISELLVCLIRESLSKLGYAQVGDFYLDLPTDSRFGDLSTNIALQLSKRAKVNPRQLASDLVKAMQPSLEKEPLRSLISQVKIEGAGFINLYFTGHYFYTQLKEVLAQGKDTFKSDFGKGKKVLLEFVSANPTGPLSVAHARQGAVGDSLANIMVFLGFEVSREYYLNDEGNQINILGNSVSLRLKELEGQRIEFPENHYQGEYIYDIARRLQAQKQKDCDIGEYAGNFILAIIKQELTDFGISFDCWYSQKELRLRGDIERVLEELKARGFVYAQEGATWFKSTNFSDDKDRVLIKSDGSYTYLAPDIAYHKTKFERGFTWLINLWGPDHHGYIGRLKASVQALGYPEDSLAVIIVQLASIYREGKVIEMSTRKGQYITLREVLDEVGKDAARFFFLMRRTSSHLDFDLEVAKKQNAENPVYYVQY